MQKPFSSMESVKGPSSEHKLSIAGSDAQSQKLDLLGLLDKSRVQFYHWTAVAIAGCGFFTDSYDLFCISTVTKLLGRLYFYDPSSPNASQPGQMSMQVVAMLSLVALGGALAGSLFFGSLGDKAGRIRSCRLCLVFMILGSLGSGLTYAKDAKVLVIILCFFRFWMGFGVGGSYPASASVMAEYSTVKTRGAFLSAIFAMQGAGIVAGAGVAIAVSEIFKKFFVCHGEDANSSCIPPLYDTPREADYVWRIILLLGAVPPFFTLLLRNRLPETPRYTILVEGDARKAAENMNKVLNVRLSSSLGEWTRWKTGGPGFVTRAFASKFGWRLAAVSCCFFLVDVSVYSQSPIQKEILSHVGWLPPPSGVDGLTEVSRLGQAMALLALLTSVPGYWVTVCTAEWLGRRMIQLQGFFFLTLVFFVIAFKFSDLRGNFCGDPEKVRWCDGHPMIFIGLYGAMYFFFNFGANATTFILSAELFPARHRSTCIGISAFVGKIGAICGTIGFLQFNEQLQDLTNSNDYDGGKENPDFKAGYMILAFCSALGFLITLVLIPETHGQSLEVLTSEELLDDSSADLSREISFTSRDQLVHV